MDRWDIVIIGAGIAGLTAAIYGQRAGKKTLVIDKEGFGGKIITTPQVDNYPGVPGVDGFELMEKIYNQAVGFGAEVKFEEVVSLDDHIVKTNSNEYYGETIIIATGSKDRRLKVKGEEENIGKGVHFCGACDAHFYKGKEVAVVGAGNTAVTDALTLSGLASKVYILVRKKGFPKAEQMLVEQLLSKDNVVVMNETEVEAIDKKERLNVLLNNGSTLEIDGLFLAIGSDPDVGIFDVEKDRGFIKVDDDMRTSKEYVFGAGDCVNRKVKQLTTAAAYGTIAGMSAISYINKKRRKKDD